MTPFKRQSMTLPWSLKTKHSIWTFHTNFPERIHKDSGSRALEPITIVYKSFPISVESFLCSSNPLLELVQSTLKKTNPSDGLSFFGDVISALAFMMTFVYPWLKTRWPTLVDKYLFVLKIEQIAFFTREVLFHQVWGCWQVFFQWKFLVDACNLY